MPLDREQYTSSNPTSFPSISIDNGIIVGDTLSSSSITTGKVLYSVSGTTYIPVSSSSLISTSIAYQPTAPSNPLVGALWVDSSSNNTSYDPNLIRRKTIVATGGQTAFTADLAFTDGYEQVFLNGLLLTKNTDYTTTNSIQVNLVVAAVVNDIIDILSVTNLNAVSATGALTTSNTFTGPQTFTPSSAAITPITVNGAFSQTADLINVKDYSANALFYIKSSGNIGMGIDPTAYKLQVNGQASFNVGSGYLRFSANNGNQPIPANDDGGSVNTAFAIGGNASNGGAEMNFWSNNPGTGGFSFLTKTGSGTYSNRLNIAGSDGSVTIGGSLTVSGGILQTTSTPTFATNNYTFASGDQNKLVLAGNGTTAGTVTVPPSVFPIGSTLTVVWYSGTGQISIAAGSGVTIYSNSSRFKLNSLYASAQLVCIASNTWIAIGNLIQ